jgi:LysM repeat protein
MAMLLVGFFMATPALLHLSPIRHILPGVLSLLADQHPRVYAQDVVYHTVRSGETVSSIAQRYGVSVNVLLSYNNISNPNLLRAGQVLRIPTAVQSTPRPQPTVTQARPVGTPRPVATPRPVVTDMTVKPTVTRPVSVERFHTVHSGDTLNGISALYGVSVAAIKARNRLSNDLIYVGQRLVIP